MITDEDFGVLEIAIRMLNRKIERNLLQLQQKVETGAKTQQEAQSIMEACRARQARLKRAVAWMRAAKAKEEGRHV